MEAVAGGGGLNVTTRSLGILIWIVGLVGLVVFATVLYLAEII
jgi:hypothetical protein